MDRKELEARFRNFGGDYNECGCPCQSWCPNCIFQVVNFVIAEEREACAKLAEEFFDTPAKVAAAIRARGNPIPVG